MQLNTPATRTYLYDGHGHSTASDGLHPPQKIIDMAVQKGLDIVGLSDHNVTKNLIAFLQYADEINKHETVILPIPSIEMSTTHGDILVAIPDRDHAENFITNYRKPTKRPNPVDIIEQYIDQYNAIIILLHPENNYVHGVSIEYVHHLLEKVSKRYHPNMGIEVYNWMTQAFFWCRSKVEKQLHNMNEIFGLAPFSFTDYHSAYHVGNGNTSIEMTELTSGAFIHAVQQRKTAPHTISNRSISEYMEIIKASLIAESITKFAHRDFRIPH